MKMESLKFLVENFGQKYSEILGINLSSGEETEIFKWFLASILFGASINETSVIKTYKCFQKYDVLTPKRILQTGWDGLVKILDEGGYTRYDFKTADKLLEVMKNLTQKYSGSLTLLHESARNTHDLENRLKELGKGVGEVTVKIFLRELRGVWSKAEPEPTGLVLVAAENLGIFKKKCGKALEQLRAFWIMNKIEDKSFVNFETALLRLGKNFCRKGKCAVCPVKDGCLTPKAA